MCCTTGTRDRQSLWPSGSFALTSPGRAGDGGTSDEPADRSLRPPPNTNSQPISVTVTSSLQKVAIVPSLSYRCESAHQAPSSLARPHRGNGFAVTRNPVLTRLKSLQTSLVPRNPIVNHASTTKLRSKTRDLVAATLRSITGESMAEPSEHRPVDWQRTALCPDRCMDSRLKASRRSFLRHRRFETERCCGVISISRSISRLTKRRY
jgi:hypothetical protein